MKKNIIIVSGLIALGVAASFVNSIFEVIEDAGHFPFIEQSESFSTVTGDFLKAL